MDLMSRLRKGERPFQSISQDGIVYFLLPEDSIKELIRTKKLPEIKLTMRQEEILNLVREGHTNKSIARLLNISVRTVETHRLLGRKRMHAR